MLLRVMEYRRQTISEDHRHALNTDITLLSDDGVNTPYINKKSARNLTEHSMLQMYIP